MDQKAEWKTLPIMIFALVFTMFLVLNVCAAFVLDFISEGYANIGSTVKVREIATGKYWNNLIQLNVFSDYESDRIYPTCSGKYGFEICNDVDFPISYLLSISDENIAEIPMQFRLQDEDGEYIVGAEDTWLPITALQDIPGTLAYEGTDQYVLDWRWSGTDDIKDTYAGIVAQEKTLYVLNFEVLGTQNGATINSLIDPAPELSNLAFWIMLLCTTLIILLYGIAWSYIRKDKENRKENAE